MDIANYILQYFKYSQDAKYLKLLEWLKEEEKRKIEEEERDKSVDEKEELLNDVLRGEIGRIINDYLAFKRMKPDLTQEDYINYRKKLKSEKFEELSEEEVEYVVWLNDNHKKIFQSPINIKDIKGLGVGKCTEHSILSQNILSFLGDNMYLISVRIVDFDNKEVLHDLNIMERSGHYIIWDILNHITQEIESQGIQEPRNLLQFGKIVATEKMTIISYFDEKEDLKELADAGKFFRADALTYLDRLLIYKELRQLDR